MCRRSYCIYTSTSCCACLRLLVHRARAELISPIPGFESAAAELEGGGGACMSVTVGQLVRCTNNYFCTDDDAESEQNLCVENILVFDVRTDSYRAYATFINR